MHNMLRRDIEDEILPYCQEQDIEMIVYSPMASGLLTGKITRERIENTLSDNWRRNAENVQEPKLSKKPNLVEKLREIVRATMPRPPRFGP
jgi:aryl-alcohol dehydrogenase-like predicted oxidoreductase